MLKHHECEVTDLMTSPLVRSNRTMLRFRAAKTTLGSSVNPMQPTGSGKLTCVCLHVHKVSWVVALNGTLMFDLDCDCQQSREDAYNGSNPWGGFQQITDAASRSAWCGRRSCCSTCLSHRPGPRCRTPPRPSC